MIPLSGTVQPTAPQRRAQTPAISLEISARRTQLQDLLRKAVQLFHSGHYREAEKSFEFVRQLAEREREYYFLGWAFLDIGACQYALCRYPAALSSFRQAHRMARLTGDARLLSTLGANIASLYSGMGDLESAVVWMQGSLEWLKGRDGVVVAQLEIQMASLRARQGRMPEALDLFRRGIDDADRAGDAEIAALGWNRLGEEIFRRGDFRGAQRPFLEAYRLRKLNHLALDVSYWNLGRLRFEQGDLKSASALLDLAVEMGVQRQGVQPLREMYAARSRVRLAQGRLHESLSDARIAVRLARSWRAEAPGDRTRIGSEGILDDIHDTLIQAGNRLYRETGDAALLRETFEAVEEIRASSLRVLARRQHVPPASRPPVYWEAVARLQAAELAALRDENPVTRDRVAAARAEVDEMESQEGSPSLLPPGQLLAGVRESLDADTALLSFAVGDSGSWLWALDRDGLALYALPPEREIRAQVQAELAAIQDDSPTAVEAGARLYATLFGPLAPRFRDRKRWLLARDEALFDVPLAALVERTVPRPVYVAESHVTVTIPGAGFWLESAGRRSAAWPSGLFVGVGDPIYNSADQRLSKPGLLGSWPPWADRAPAQPLALPRLVASGAEVERCARAWGGDRTILEGGAASGRNLADQLRRHPAVVHFATHILEAGDGHHSGLIALSLRDGRVPELVAPEQIAGWNLDAGVVVLNGCHSASGDVLPGTGLLGLTRAWLTAGARAVVASQWPTPDDSGPLFDTFYRSLGPQRSSSPGEALRRAQVDMIRAGGWRARPRYWAAYFVVGSE
jgi:CHAT domain-containing protein/tetratricopeptide (TPR) repeat protein